MEWRLAGCSARGSLLGDGLVMEKSNMPSPLSNAASDESPVSDRRAWFKPAFDRLDTGEAEGNDSTGTDGGQVS